MLDGSVVVNLTDQGTDYSSDPVILIKGSNEQGSDYVFSFVEKSAVSLEVEAWDPDGTVERVRFYGNGKLLGSKPPGNITRLFISTPAATDSFSAPPTISFIGSATVEAEATAEIDENGSLIGLKLVNPGSGYNSVPQIVIQPSNGAIIGAEVNLDVVNNARQIAGTNRWVLNWAPQTPGTYRISAEAIDNAQQSTLIKSDRYVTIVPESSSKTPVVSLLGPSDLQSYTSGSQLRIYAKASDVDGTLQWVRFYVNGEPYGDPIPRFSGKSSANYPYGIDWVVPAPGVYSFLPLLWITVGMESCPTFPPSPLPRGTVIFPLSLSSLPCRWRRLKQPSMGMATCY